MSSREVCPHLRLIDDYITDLRARLAIARGLLLSYLEDAPEGQLAPAVEDFLASERKILQEEHSK